MLLGNDVFKLKGSPLEFLRHAAVFTQVARPVSNLLSKIPCHGALRTDAGRYASETGELLIA